ncbi:MAG: 2-oxoglutarate dehydrogenase complex dihydrolipoyllysine-residue succinyltransferase [Isosphaeraceae bacterium]
MAAVPITVPGVGESITEGILSKWLKPDGSAVKAGEPLFELETDKATNVVPAAVSGVLKATVKEGETVAIGASIGTLDPAGTPSAADGQKAPAKDAAKAAPSESPKPAPAPAGDGAKAAPEQPLSPAVRRIVAENNVDPSQVAPSGPGGRLTKGDVLAHLEAKGDAATTVKEPPAAAAATAPAPPAPAPARPDGERETRQRMSGLRQRIAQRLVEAQQTAAILTTFNEADLSAIGSIRERYKELFRTRHGVGLGYMSFFVKASIEALKAFPAVNGRIDGTDIVHNNYYDIGVAVSTERGLMVPVLRDADRMSFAAVEKAIVGFAEKARTGTITVDELQGGTFTITNGGIFGSMLSTPILNPPQSAILGMHAIKKRPVVVDDQIVIRPMMYLALSYDHRIIDGREAVSFLVRIKECLEDPGRMLLEL